MTIVPVGNAHYVGNSGDSRPSTGIVSGARLTEYGPPTLDYYWDGSAWIPLVPTSGRFDLTSGSTLNTSTIISGLFNVAVFSGRTSFLSGSVVDMPQKPVPIPFYTVFRSGSVFHAQKYDGTYLTSVSGKPFEVIQAAINATSGSLVALTNLVGSVYINPGDYNAESGAPGLDMTPGLALIMDRKTVIDLPLGYSGHFIRLTSGANTCRIQGGHVREGGTAVSGIGYDWAAIKIEATNVDDILYNQVENMVIERAGAGILFYAHTSGQITNNTFTDIKMIGCKRSIDFDISGYTLAGGMPSRCDFKNIYCQTQGATDIGIKDVQGRGNKFDNVVQIDINLGSSGNWALCSRIGSGATDTIIIGGVMTNDALITAGLFSGQRSFQNYGSGTKIMGDPFWKFQTDEFRWDGALASGKTNTATMSSAFAPLGYMVIKVSGNGVKVPYFAT